MYAFLKSCYIYHIYIYYSYYIFTNYILHNYYILQYHITYHMFDVIHKNTFISLYHDILYHWPQGISLLNTVTQH